jgi:hypothetical protein
VRVALDTNILACAEGLNGAKMKGTALGLLERLPQQSALLPVQTLGELFHLLVRKARRAPATARKAILSWKDAFPLIDTSAEVMFAAADLATTINLVSGTPSCFLPPPRQAAGFYSQRIYRRGLRGEVSRSQTLSPCGNTNCSAHCLPTRRAEAK